jgi:hypothetical protein
MMRRLLGDYLERSAQKQLGLSQWAKQQAAEALKMQHLIDCFARRWTCLSFTP